MPATGPVKLKLETFKPPGRREGENHVADAAEVSTGQQTTKLKLLDSLVNGTGDSLQAGEMPGQALSYPLHTVHHIHDGVWRGTNSDGEFVCGLMNGLYLEPVSSLTSSFTSCAALNLPQYLKNVNTHSTHTEE